MTWTAPADVVDGQDLTAAFYNPQVPRNLSHLKSRKLEIMDPTYEEAGIQWGVVNVTVSSSETGSAPVTFPIAFASAPRVFPSCKDTTVYNAYKLNVTANGFDAHVRHNTAVSLSATIPLEWLAVGK